MLRQMALPTNKLTYTLSLIENQYVDSVAMDSLAEHVIPLLVKELDPHSVYIPAAEMQQLNEPLEGEFDGIGVVFNMATDTVIVLNVIPQGPERQGRNQGRRPHHRDQRHARGGTEDSAARRGEETARSARQRQCTSDSDGRESASWSASMSYATRFRSRASNRHSASPTASVTSNWGSSPAPPPRRWSRRWLRCGRKASPN